jgi:ankyrin repeat protein
MYSLEYGNKSDMPLNIQMQQALYKKNIGTIYKLLHKGVDVNVRGKFGQTPLIFAAQMGNYLLTHKLISMGANLELSTYYPISEKQKSKENSFNFVNTNEETALWWAAKNGNLEVVKILLKNGAEVDRNRLGPSPLMEACKHGYLEIVLQLLKYKMDVNYICFDKVDYDFTFPLKEAVRYKYKNIVILLLEQNINFHIGKCSISVFEIATIRKYSNILGILIKNLEIRNKLDEYMEHLSKCLIIAGRIGSKSIMTLLIEKGVDINVLDIDENNTLMEICKTVYDELAELMIEVGINLKQRNIYGEDALMIAIKNDNIVMANMIYEKLKEDDEYIDGLRKLDDEKITEYLGKVS